MTDKQQKMFSLVWDLVLQQNALLFEVHSMGIQMFDLLKCGSRPTPEQFAAWDAGRIEVTNKLLELTSTLELLSQKIQPSWFDS